MKTDDHNATWDFSSVLANSVHDMKNSLSLLINNVESIVERCKDEQCEAVGDVAQLGYEAKRINNRLVQLLSLYKFEQNQYHLNRQETELAEFLEEIKLTHQDLLATNGIDIDIDCADDAVWSFDPGLVTGVANNIINNAFRYARSKILIRVTQDKHFLSLEINDDGDGFPSHLCDMSGQPLTSVNFTSGSTGLGLYFAHQIARMHDRPPLQGSIHLFNGGTLGGGCFTLTLP